VRVSAFDGFGNGVLLSSTEVLTAYHVVAAAHQTGRTVQVQWPAEPGKEPLRRAASIVGVDQEADLALLAVAPVRTQDIDLARLPLTGGGLCGAGAAALNGDVVVLETTGNAVEGPFVYRVFGHRVASFGQHEYLTDVPGIEGLSGSPLYVASSRQLAGIATKKSTGLTNVNPIIAIDACYIAELLPDLTRG
jgi:S1-C subfamily serine protease